MKISLTIPQVIVLDLLCGKGRCQMNELAKSLNFTMSAVTSIIDKMELQKLVKRQHSKEDRRVVEVVMLKKGKEAAEFANKERQKVADSFFSVLNKKEKEEYLRLVNKVYNSLKKR